MFFILKTQQNHWLWNGIRFTSLKYCICHYKATLQSNEMPKKTHFKNAITAKMSSPCRRCYLSIFSPINRSEERGSGGLGWVRLGPSTPPPPLSACTPLTSGVNLPPPSAFCCHLSGIDSSCSPAEMKPEQRILLIPSRPGSQNELGREGFTEGSAVAPLTLPPSA